MFCYLGFGQVGIGTTTPRAALEIKSTDEEMPLATDGFLVPRVTNFPLIDPTASQHGMLLWYSNPTIPLVEGFYYWNHTQGKWVPLMGE